ncbi:hypothetical protein BJ170DRAFT_678920 [Xylariales sp. AK1849]|nr:hypothetical protein BJ170DRAFT_678920 [Xylariales sp. AK1849]
MLTPFNTETALFARSRAGMSRFLANYDHFVASQLHRNPNSMTKEAALDRLRLCRQMCDKLLEDTKRDGDSRGSIKKFSAECLSAERCYGRFMSVNERIRVTWQIGDLEKRLTTWLHLLQADSKEDVEDTLQLFQAGLEKGRLQRYEQATAHKHRQEVELPAKAEAGESGLDEKQRSLTVEVVSQWKSYHGIPTPQKWSVFECVEAWKEAIKEQRSEPKYESMQEQLAAFEDGEWEDIYPEDELEIDIKFDAEEEEDRYREGVSTDEWDFVMETPFSRVPRSKLVSYADSTISNVRLSDSDAETKNEAWLMYG